jgi:hypothetical protein
MFMNMLKCNIKKKKKTCYYTLYKINQRYIQSKEKKRERNDFLWQDIKAEQHSKIVKEVTVPPT